jgi:uncharacterized glyoxalase superfamily protein PhnB
MFKTGVPILAANDIEATLDYYRRVLGFASSWTWGEPPTFGSVSWGNVTVMFNLQPEIAAHVRGHQHWFEVENVDAMCERHVAHGANIVSPIADKPWGLREYIVEDPNGYHLRFAARIREEPVEPSAPFPPGVALVRRLPTEEEFARVAGQEFYRDGVPTGVLERSWQGVVALSPEGEAIATLRIVQDAPGWFSVWDVAVLPEWRGRHIGAEIMREALDLVREASPGAFVYLFTFRQGFYARLGFADQTVSMIKV